ncbi:MerR family transcriptional regulator [Bariatricus massiliensis]|uniref:MerR family transcriptional regulator n=1 Tax=Bariatricus massiliensis TaxID=1745713 RepID=A0ABS8DGK6_9FIRM|nr:MerR family transcriptional regulator [Bariatricus massiliensis]MCB7304444.1 MerR family transcriptional regulator [Bariatricus massiliensis]MCB7375095.1 MerR family transcriptional regulator [Bariatricus massiliensis]MCB7387554.1 MerR family transcriptional regulator [Bariatricus massiliensis]MCB7411716.1 MerR family transcriptional regulator [Bariatricus massiliensis]MCQ5253851.1 MerR family transcriptional regulator [Bariatricus massiliensis]
MKTVKEVSHLTGISVRTLHYYDEIGLLKPTRISEAGYRLYDDKALEELQQILFFREFDMPLKEIKAVMGNPDLDKNQLLSNQKKILVLKKERLERIIASIEDILEGDNKMDFEVFSKAEIEQMYEQMSQNMTEEQKKIFVQEYGSMEAFEKHFVESASGEEAQKNFAKVVEWYGDKDSTLYAAKAPENSEIVEAYSKRYEQVIKKLVSMKGKDVTTFEVKQIVGELDFVVKQLYRMKDVTAFMLQTAEMYMDNKEMQESLDQIHGGGSAMFIGKALKAFYGSHE